MRDALVLFCVKALFIEAPFITAVSNIDMIHERISNNKCRINREELIFQMQEIEYLQDTTFTEIPQFLLADSLLVCPVTGQFYLFEADGNDRTIICPAGHGVSSF